MKHERHFTTCPYCGRDTMRDGRSFCYDWELYEWDDRDWGGYRWDGCSREEASA